MKTAEQNKQYQFKVEDDKFTVTEIKKKAVKIKYEDGTEITLKLNDFNENLESGEIIDLSEPEKVEIEPEVEYTAAKATVDTSSNPERPYMSMTKDELKSLLESYRDTLRKEITQSGSVLVQNKMYEIEAELEKPGRT